MVRVCQLSVLCTDYVRTSFVQLISVPALFVQQCIAPTLTLCRENAAYDASILRTSNEIPDL